MGITRSCWLCYTRRSGDRRTEQGLVIEQRTESEEGCNAQAWRRRITHAAAREWIEHPRGNGQLKAILEFDHQILGALTP